MALTVIFSFLINLVLIQGRTEVGKLKLQIPTQKCACTLVLILLSIDKSSIVIIGPGPGFRPDNYTHFDVYASALSKAHYNPWACDYRSEPGYKCLSCSSALHCYPGNFALLVQCAGIFPFCRNGYCSRFKTEGCTEETDPSLVHSTLPPLVQVFNTILGNKTTLAPVTSTNHEITEPILNDSVPQDSASKPVATQSNDPNTISGGMVKPSNAGQTNNVPVNKKPKDSPQSLQITEEINSLTL